MAETISELRERAARLARPSRSPDERLSTHAREERDRAAQRAGKILADSQGRERTVAETSALSSAYELAEQWDKRHARHEKRVAASSKRYRVTREPLTYERGGEHSYVSDCWQSKLGDADATARLQRHARESEVELRAFAATSEREQRQRGDLKGLEYRTTPQPAPGLGGAFTPPLWVIADWAGFARPQRVVSARTTNLHLPQGVGSVNLPRVTTGTSTGPQAGAGAASETDLADASASSTVVTVAGHADVPLAMLEQSPAGSAHLDQIVFGELRAAYDAEIEREVVAGLGASNRELLGVMSTPGITNVNAPTAGVPIFKALAEAFGAVSNARKLAPSGLYLRGGKWAYLATLLDKEERPLLTPMAMEATEEIQPIGSLLGLPSFLTEAISSTISTNQDAILALRPEDQYLFESTPSLNVFEGALSATLEARIEYRAYAAFVTRYPSSVAVVTGAGLSVATNE